MPSHLAGIKFQIFLKENFFTIIPLWKTTEMLHDTRALIAREKFDVLSVLCSSAMAKKRKNIGESSVDI